MLSIFALIDLHIAVEGPHLISSLSFQNHVEHQQSYKTRGKTITWPTWTLTISLQDRAMMNEASDEEKGKGSGKEPIFFSFRPTSFYDAGESSMLAAPAPRANIDLRQPLSMRIDGAECQKTTVMRPP